MIASLRGPRPDRRHDAAIAPRRAASRAAPPDAPGTAANRKAGRPIQMKARVCPSRFSPGDTPQARTRAQRTRERARSAPCALRLHPRCSGSIRTIDACFDHRAMQSLIESAQSMAIAAPMPNASQCGGRIRRGSFPRRHGIKRRRCSARANPSASKSPNAMRIRAFLPQRRLRSFWIETIAHSAARCRVRATRSTSNGNPSGFRNRRRKTRERDKSTG